MPTPILHALDAKIGELEAQLDALRSARSALAGTAASRRAGSGAKGTRKRKFNAAQRAEISRRMKALWKKRRATGKV